VSAARAPVAAAAPARPTKGRAWRGVAAAVLAFGGLLALFAQQAWWQRALRALFPGQRAVMFERATLLELSLQHLEIVGLSLALILVISLPLSVWLTRPQGRAFLPLASSLLSVGQTFPPIAVLALALPAFGFGLRPTLIALVAYGLLPVTRNAIAGFEAVPATLKEAATGMGMNAWERLWRLELPLATRVILAGVRTSTVYTIGTATVAPIIGAGGLGVPIIAGLTTGNLAYVLQGAVPVALLALLADYALGRLEVALTPTGII
jgi:osmoprotectant transport system permease protein